MRPGLLNQGLLLVALLAQNIQPIFKVQTICLANLSHHISLSFDS
jgi:hypothetical protein